MINLEGEMKMNNNDLVKNDLNFTPITVPVYKIIAIYGNIRSRMPDFKKAIEQGYNVGNYRDLATKRMEQHNPDANDRALLNDNYFTLVGNPTLGDPANSGEQIIINDLEQKVFQPLKLQLLNMNSSTKLNSSWALPLAESKEEAKAIYDKIKTNGAPYITVLSPKQVKELRNNLYALPNVRERILEGFLQGNLTEKKDYVKHVKAIKQVDDMSRILGYAPGGFTDMRLVWAGSVGNYYANAYSSNSLNYYYGRLFGVGARGAGAPTEKSK